jgi:HPt (histidine-containing phosphotransfer) domain-containing protein
MTDHDGAPIIEAEQLTVLAEAAGKEAIEPILDAFWQSNDELFGQLTQAFATGDAGEAAKIAHALKGSASNLGALRLSESAKAVERAAKAGDLETARDALGRLPSEIEVTKDAFARLMASIG